MIRAIIDRVQGKAPKGAKRSPKWRKVRKIHLKKHAACAVCESKNKLEVHHMVPFHVAPELELEPTNLVTLCENKRYGINCHLLIGHLGNYRKQNLDVKSDIEEWNKKIKG